MLPDYPVNYADIDLLSDIDSTEGSQSHRRSVSSACSSSHSKKHSSKKGRSKSKKEKKTVKKKGKKSLKARESSLQSPQVHSPEMTRNSSNSLKAGTLPDAEFLAKMKKDMEQMAEKNKELQQQVADLAAKKPDSKDEDSDEDEVSDSDEDEENGGSSLVKKTKSMMDKIRDGMRNFQFRKIKFLNSPSLAKPHMLSLLKFIKGENPMITRRNGAKSTAKHTA